MTVLPIFPLQSVLFPGMPLALRVFEMRYLVLLEHVLNGGREFGVVLIERGPEVGGGDRRFTRGTVARVSQHRVVDHEWVAVFAVGGRRFEVDRWLADDPYPQAVVEWLPELGWSEDLRPLRTRAERTVRRTLATAAEFGATAWPASVELDDDPILSAWQLAAVAPVGPLDHLALLGASSAAELLERTAEMAAAAASTIALAAGDDLGFPFDPPEER